MSPESSLRRMGRWTTLGCLATLLTACAVGPDYRQPTVQLPRGWE